MSGTRRKPGAMDGHIDCHRSYLLALGYTPETARGLLTVVGRLGRWMAARRLRPEGLDWVVMERFLTDCRADRSQQTPYRRNLLQVLEHLVGEGIVSGAVAGEPSPLDLLVDAYRHWLLTDRGLAATTVQRYERTARRFLRRDPASEQMVDVAGLTGAEVSRFLLAEAARCSVGAAKGRVAELRSLLRYLYLHGLTARPLAAAVPPVAGWHDTGIPRMLSTADVDALLASCDRSSPVGVRDYAIMLLVARLGLRSVEVARLHLQDVDWRRGELTVHGKASRQDRMPLPVEVGQALVAYLRDARPATEARGLFLTCRAPRRQIEPAMVGGVVKLACGRAGLPVVGPHRMRHALATNMLARGVALIDISQVLRHRDLATTAVYAKVDLASLRLVARPWPGSPR